MNNFEDYNSIVQWSYGLAKNWVNDNLIPIGVNSARKFARYKRTINKLPSHFPRRPDDYFTTRGSWKGWNDFFGNPVHNLGRQYLGYVQCKEFVQKVGLKNSREFRNWKDRPAKVPSRPDLYYKEWETWMEFLGDNYVRTKSTFKGKLTERDVKIIKHQISLGVSGAALAKHFNVSEMQISRIKSGENWSHVAVVQ